MKMQSTMPTEGQFVAVWEHNNVLWSATYKWNEDGELLEFDYDEWLEVGGFHDIHPKEAIYLVG